MYRDHKSAVIAEDNQKLSQFQGGCPKPKEVQTKEELEAQMACMQKDERQVDDSDLGLLMRRHLKAPVAPLRPGAACAPFRQVDLSQINARTRGCLARVGDAKWTAEGLVDAAPSNASAASASCSRRWMGTAGSSWAATAGCPRWPSRRTRRRRWTPSAGC